MKRDAEPHRRCPLGPDPTRAAGGPLQFSRRRRRRRRGLAQAQLTDFIRVIIQVSAADVTAIGALTPGQELTIQGSQGSEPIRRFIVTLQRV
jgi:hypothetical protein